MATRRNPIPFETGDKRKDPKSIRWGKVWAVEDGNSEGKDGILKVELQSHKKIRGGAPSPRYSPHAPLPTLHLLLYALLLSQHAQKHTQTLKGGRGWELTRLICFY